VQHALLQVVLNYRISLESLVPWTLGSFRLHPLVRRRSKKEYRERPDPGRCSRDGEEIMRFLLHTSSQDEPDSCIPKRRPILNTTSRYRIESAHMRKWRQFRSEPDSGAPMSFTKSEVVESVVAETGFTRKKAVETVEALLEIIKRSL